MKAQADSKKYRPSDVMLLCLLTVMATLCSLYCLGLLGSAPVARTPLTGEYSLLVNGHEALWISTDEDSADVSFGEHQLRGKLVLARSSGDLATYNLTRLESRDDEDLTSCAFVLQVPALFWEGDPVGSCKAYFGNYQTGDSLGTWAQLESDGTASYLRLVGDNPFMYQDDQLMSSAKSMRWQEVDGAISLT